MGSFYTVVRYVPDPIADERVNIGVIAFQGDQVKSVFLRRWTRVKQLGLENIDFLRDFADAVENRQLPLFESSRQWDEKAVREAVGAWANSIQFSAPKASTMDAAQTIASISKRVLLQADLTPRKRARDKRAVVSLGAAKLHSALIQETGELADDLLKKRLMVEGKLQLHSFDLGVKNGEIIAVAQGLSFEGRHTLEQVRDADAAKWAVDDVRKRHKDAAIAILALPPKSADSKSHKAYEELRHVLKGLDAELVRETKLAQWATMVAKSAAAHIGN